MKEAVIREKLAELSMTITRSPRGKSVRQGDDGLYISNIGSDSAKAGKVSIDESLELIGLQVKYMAFDLEATRRENSYLRQMLDSRSGPGCDGQSGN